MSVLAGPPGLPVRCACLVILDGWGLAPPGPGNAITLASTPIVDELWATYPHASSRRADGRSACPRARWVTRKWGT